jgi:hypothetical protein
MVMDRKEFNAHIKDVSKDIRGAGLGIARDTAKADADSKGKRGEDMEKRFVPSPYHPHGGYYAATEGEAKDHREAMLASSQFKESLQKLSKLRDEVSALELAGAKANIRSAKIKELQSLQGQATVQFGKMNKLGSFDNGLRDLAQGVLGGSTDFSSPVPQYNSLIERIDSAMAAQARANTGYMRPQIQQAAPSFKPVGK